jgi:hypothetical protein
MVCGLFDLGFSGPAYTWINMRFSSTPIFERLDRCLANAEWCVRIRIGLEIRTRDYELSCITSYSLLVLQILYFIYTPTRIRSIQHKY